MKDHMLITPTFENAKAGVNCKNYVALVPYPLSENSEELGNIIAAILKLRM